MKTLAGKYEILKILGEGGFGTVYLARHIELEDLYAIKLLKKEISQEEDLIQRFKREASVIKKLLHPNSVTLRDFGRTDEGYFYMAMDFCEGESMDKILLQEGPMAPERVLKLMVQILEVVGEAHRLGIIHRDLKPENIVMERDGKGQERAKVLDFGIAKLRETMEKKQSSITREGHVIGTPLYMSPEQANGEELEPTSDIYSLGMVMYNMLSGKPAFARSTIIRILQQQLYEYPKRLSELIPPLPVPPEVETIVFKAILKEPGKRFQSTQEFKKACLEYLETKSWAGTQEASQNFEEALTLSADTPLETKMVSSTSQESPLSTRSTSWLPWLILALLFAFAGGYLLLFPKVDHKVPQIFIESPLSGMATKAPFVMIKGHIQGPPQVELMVQNVSVPLKKGHFETKVLLPQEGTTVVVLEARDSQGNTRKEKITLVVDRTPPIISIESPSSPLEVSEPHLNILGSISDSSPPLQITVAGKEVKLKNNILKTHVDIKEGLNVIEIRAVDALGNEDKKTLEITGNLTCPAPKILSPAPNTTTKKKEIFVECSFPKKASKVLIGGTLAESLGQGKFRALVALKVGENTITVSIWDNFNRTSENQIKVIREKPLITKPPITKPLPDPTLGWKGEKMPPGLAKRMKRKAGEPPFRKVDGSVTGDPKEAQEYRRTKDDAIMVFLPAGDFEMGASEGDKEAADQEKPQLFVHVEGYYIDKYEVTYRQFEKFIKETNYQTTAEKKGKSYSFAVQRNVEGLSWKNPWPHEKQQRRTPLYPVNHIGYDDALAYTRWAGAAIPTEAQWEMAARGIAGRKYPWGPELPNAGGAFRANSSGYSTPGEDGYPFLSPGGSYEKGVSSYGIFDMAGNVYEWCLDGWKEDVYRDYQKRQRGSDPINKVFYSPRNSDRRVLRGGSWASSVDSLRCSFRASAGLTTTADNMGFRCVVELKY